jgi:metal-responsive CopG/Arc/MetJ family transcriptional regulator
LKATVKKTISLPRDLAREVEETARTEGKSVSAVIEDALRKKRGDALWKRFKASQAYWSRIAKEKGIRTEADLRRYLAK